MLRIFGRYVTISDYIRLQKKMKNMERGCLDDIHRKISRLCIRKRRATIFALRQEG